MPREDTEFLAALGVPQPRRLVFTSSQHLLAVRRERYGVNLIGMPREDAEFLAALGVPQPRRLVIAAGQHLLAVRRECHGGNSHAHAP